MNRRELLRLASAFASLTITAAKAEDDASDVVAFLKTWDAGQITLGRNILPPTDPSWKDAFKILGEAPRGKRPFEVAQYFKESVPARFQEAWPESDANPVIVKFFYDLKQKPAGDTTPGALRL